MAISKIPSAGFQDNVKFRNLIINGSMDIAQRGTSFSSMSNGQFITDRFFYDRAGLGVTAAFTGSQSTDVPSGTSFSNSLKMDVTTAQTLGASGGTYLGVTTKVEGYNYKLVSNQKAIISFWVKSNLTGTYSIVFRNNGNDRVLVEEYTINSASTWEKKTIALPTFTTDGTWNYTNGMGVSIFYCLAVAGDNDTSTIGSWISSGVSSIYGSSNNVEFASNTANEWYITGVQLEAGTTASNFEFLPYDINQQRCFRYYENIVRDVSGMFSMATSYTSTRADGILTYTEKRTLPSLDQRASTDDLGYARNGSVKTFNSLAVSSIKSNRMRVSVTPLTGTTAGYGGWFQTQNTSAYISIDAEL